MKKVITKKLPSGAIPFADVRDANVRIVLMRMNDNIRSLKGQLEEVQKAIRELQRR